MSTKPLVIYHANCTDGFAAAYAAWTQLGDDAEYVPMHYGFDTTNFPDRVGGRDVYILDFSLPRHLMDVTLRLAKRLVWLDHHKTAFEMWLPDGAFKKGDKFIDAARSDEKYILLDDNKSGAMLAWEFFNPDRPVPPVIANIDDRDRWQWALAYSREVHLALQTMQPWSFRQWASDVVHPSAYGPLFTQGQAIAKAIDQQIDQSAKRANECNIRHPDGGYEHLPWLWDSGGFWMAPGLAVNSPANISEVGHELANQSDTYGLVWYYDGKTKRANCSLRSNGDYDVSAIAKVFGGGGHKNAAGFNVPMATLMSFFQ